MKSRKIVVGSTNIGKVKEFTAIIHEFEYLNLDIVSMDHQMIAESDEPYAAFIQNAIHKAKYYSKITGSMVLAEDSDLCIEALNGFPGIDTKNFITK